MSRSGRDERGAVTAELAMVLPLLLAVTAGLVWFLVVGLGQVRVTDAAREAARALARGESVGTATEVATTIAPTGAGVEVSQSGGLVEVTVTARVEGPGGVLAAVPGADVESTATAALEPSVLEPSDLGPAALGPAALGPSALGPPALAPFAVGVTGRGP